MRCDPAEFIIRKAVRPRVDDRRKGTLTKTERAPPEGLVVSSRFLPATSTLFNRKLERLRYFSRKMQKAIAPRFTRSAIAFCLGIVLSIVINTVITSQLSPLLAQTARPNTVAQTVYQNLPFLPLENEYLSQSGEVASGNTLLSRLLRYHEYVKSRPVNYRFDWQLTFADYFGINELIKADRYPGHETLTVNPLEGDREAITSLTREQRNELIDTLLAIYNPQTDTPQQPTVTPNNSEEQKPSLPQPGDADLLLLE